MDIKQYQLDLFPEKEEVSLRREIELLKEKYERQRKAYYVKNSEHRKEIEDLKYQVQNLVRAVCRSKEIQKMFIITEDT